MPAAAGVKPKSTTSGCPTCGRESIAGGCNGEGRMQVCLTLVNGTGRDLGPQTSKYRSPSHIGRCRRATGNMQGPYFPRLNGGSVTFRRVSAHISNWKVFRIMSFWLCREALPRFLDSDGGQSRFTDLARTSSKEVASISDKDKV